MRLNNTNLNFENEEGTIDYKEKKKFCAGRAQLAKRFHHSSMRSHLRSDVLCDFLLRRVTTLGRSHIRGTKSLESDGRVRTDETACATSAENHAI